MKTTTKRYASCSRVTGKPRRYSTAYGRSSANSSTTATRYKSLLQPVKATPKPSEPCWKRMAQSCHLPQQQQAGRNRIICSHCSTTKSRYCKPAGKPGIHVAVCQLNAFAANHSRADQRTSYNAHTLTKAWGSLCQAAGNKRFFNLTHQCKQ